MKLTGSYRLPCADAERVYRTLQDPSVLARCMPGCESLDKIADNEYAVKLKMAIAAFSGSFGGKVRIADAKPHESFKLMVDGSGKIGFMKGEGLLHFQPVEGGCDVVYEGDVQVGGTIAAIGQRLIDTTSKMMIKRFFDKISEEFQPPSGT